MSSIVEHYQRMYTFCHTLSRRKVKNLLTNLTLNRKPTDLFLVELESVPIEMRKSVIAHTCQILRDILNVGIRPGHRWRVDNYLRMEKILFKFWDTPKMCAMYNNLLRDGQENVEYSAGIIITESGKLTIEQCAISYKQFIQILRNRIMYPECY